MNKIILSVAAMFFAVGVYAQRIPIAVLDFKAGAGVNQNDVNGISAILITFLSEDPQFAVIERNQINKLFEEQNIQHTSLTNPFILAKMGEMFNIRYVVVGDVNIVAEQYNIDCRALNVKTGNTVATAGEMWAINTSYRDVMKRLAQTLSSKIKNTKDNDDDEQIQPTVTINGVQWATCNVGRKGEFAKRPEELGSLYTWKEAQSACPSGFRLPTKSEMQSLEFAGSKLIPYKGVNGITYGNYNTIFLPATGFSKKGERKSNGLWGCYWTNSNKRHALHFNVNTNSNTATNIVKTSSYTSSASNTNGVTNVGGKLGKAVRCVKE